MLRWDAFAKSRTRDVAGGGSMKKIVTVLMIGTAMMLAGCGREPGPAGPKGEAGAQGPAGPRHARRPGRARAADKPAAGARGPRGPPGRRPCSPGTSSPARLKGGPSRGQCRTVCASHFHPIGDCLNSVVSCKSTKPSCHFAPGGSAAPRGWSERCETTPDGSACVSGGPTSVSKVRR